MSTPIDIPSFQNVQLSTGATQGVPVLAVNPSSDTVSEMRNVPGGPTITVSTVNDLTALSAGVPGVIYQTRGRRSSTGGGANRYYYNLGSSDVCDGGFVLDGIGGSNFPGDTAATYNGTGIGRFIAIDQSVADAKQFGATGDGISDDTFRIQAAISSGAPLIFPDSSEHVCSGLILSNNRIISRGAILKAKAGTEGVVVLSIQGDAEIRGELIVDLDGQARIANSVESEGNTAIDTLRVRNAIDGAGLVSMAIQIRGGSFIAKNILTNSAGYAGLSVGGLVSPINEIVVDYVESIDYFYKGFRCNEQVELISIGTFLGESNSTNAATNGFLIDTGGGGKEVESLYVGQLKATSMQAVKLDLGTKDVRIDAMHVTAANGGSYPVFLSDGRNISLGSVVINTSVGNPIDDPTALAPVAMRIGQTTWGPERVDIGNMHVECGGASVHPLLFRFRASGTMTVNINTLSVADNPRADGFILLDGNDSDQELHCHIGEFRSPDNLPVKLTSKPTNTGAITFGKLIGYSGVAWVATVADRNYVQMLHNQRVLRVSSAPTTGTHKAGDIAWIPSPVSGRKAGYICVADGTPGTWQQFGRIMLSGSLSYNPPSLADGEGVTSPDITVPGAAPGDHLDVSFGAPMQGVNIFAWVESAGIANARFENHTGGTVDLDTNTIYIGSK